MKFAEFERRAHEIFDEIPPRFREGVDGLVVERDPHPVAEAVAPARALPQQLVLRRIEVKIVVAEIRDVNEPLHVDVVQRQPPVAPLEVRSHRVVESHVVLLLPVVAVAPGQR